MPCTDSRDREHPLALRFHHDRLEELCEALIATAPITVDLRTYLEAFAKAYEAEKAAFKADGEAIDHGQPHRYQIEQRAANLRARGLEG